MNGKELKEVFEQTKKKLICPRCSRNGIENKIIKNDIHFRCSRCSFIMKDKDGYHYIKVTNNNFICYWDLVLGKAKLSLFENSEYYPVLFKQEGDIVDVAINFDELKKIIMLV